jgi:DNA-binding transcriptional MocR family regulator
MPAGVSWTKPEGGMFVWMTLPRPIDGAELLKRAITEKRIAFVPGYAFFADRSGRNTIRLNFSLNDPVTIDEGLKRLGNLISSM